MEHAALIRKDIGGYPFAVLDAALFDTVPAESAGQWLAAAPDAEMLILCGVNQYPKCVKAFLDAHPNGRVYAAPYTAYTLAGILGDRFSCTLVRDGDTVPLGGGEIRFRVVSQPGKGAYLVADCGERGCVSGAEDAPFSEPVVYDTPTVVLVYVSGCDYTETVAEQLARGIRDSEDLDVKLIDLASTDTREAIRALIGASGVLIGTPCVNGEAHRRVWDLLTAMPGGEFAGKFAAAFGSYTWNGKAVPHVVERMRQLRMDLPDGGFTVQYRPDEAALNSAYEYGYYFGCKLQNKPNTHRSKLVKCLVCGEIFDASLGVCPVCGVGMDKCVPVEDEVIGYKEDTHRQYVIAGGGIAALSAAQAIRRRDKTGTITLLSAEDCPPINRPMLTKNMTIAARVKDSLAVKPPEWFQENGVEIRLSTRVTAIDPARRRVVLDDGSALPYDKLIYALGAECFIPNIPGREQRGVFSIRSLSDVQAIWSLLPQAKTAVVIGGGVLGLEAAAELKKARLAVTVLEMAPKLMSRQLDDETSAQLIRAGADYGIQILTGVQISGIRGDGAVTGVELDDGSVFPADLVVISCGARANTQPASAAGVACGRAVQVTPYMETNLPDIYACGDCAELDGVNFQLWAEAAEQGRVAGANAVGDRVKYTAVPYGASFEGMNTSLYAIGDVGKEGKEYRIVEFRDEFAHSFYKYWFADNRLCGGILYGNTDRVQSLTDALVAKRDYFQMKEFL
jgi:NADPH-dependent 2,4-dienoyl-CoA reductase/sulfur reductase-like enzyme/flavodoxin